MSKVVTRPLSPWFETIQKALQFGSGTEPILIFGPLGSYQIECAREIHSNAGSGPIERVRCTSNSAELRTQLFGPASDPLDDFSWFDPDPPVGAVQRATGGTLFLEFIDHCHHVDVQWLSNLLVRQSVTIDGSSTELDPNTRVIASITINWTDGSELAIPQWLMGSFNDRILELKPLGSRPGDVSVAIEWFLWRASADRDDVVELSSDAKELLVSRQWPGNYEELDYVIKTLVSNSTIGEVVTVDTCQRVLSSSNSLGMGAVDSIRWQKCRNYANGLTYLGHPVEARELYQWAGQFSKVSRDREFDPWEPGLRIVKEIAHRYYYSSDQLRILIRDAYLSLCDELAKSNFMTDRLQPPPDGSVPKLQAVLVNPHGPVKSSAGVLPHIAHLLGGGRRQLVMPIDKVAECLARNNSIQMIMFCDDFAGTGQQILTQLIEVLAADKLLEIMCASRRQEGKPVTLGIVLGISFDHALTKIRTSGPEWLPIMAHAGEQLSEHDRAFSDSSRVFPEPEFRAWAKDLVIEQVGKQLSRRWPGGYDDGQALIVTADNVPNNTIPAVCRSGSIQGVSWQALFERVSTPSI